MKRIDKEIKRKVKSVRLEVPQHVEEHCLTQLSSSHPLEPHNAPSITRFWPLLALAASLILVVGWLFIQKVFLPSAGTPNMRQEQVFIRTIDINGKPAKTYYFQSKDKNRVIVWTQEIS